MIQQILVIGSLVPLPFLKPAWTFTDDQLLAPTQRQSIQHLNMVAEYIVNIIKLDVKMQMMKSENWKGKKEQMER